MYLVLAIGAWVVAAVLSVGAFAQGDADLAQWLVAALWVALGLLWFTQWRRAVKKFDADQELDRSTDDPTG